MISAIIGGRCYAWSANSAAGVHRSKQEPERGVAMCRSIKPLHNLTPPATDDEVRGAAHQFVRKLSGSTRPSKANELVFARAIDQVAHTVQELLDALVTNAPPRHRDRATSRVRAAATRRVRASDARGAPH